jgi:N-acetylmuramoyl-L-alanine amidase
MRNNDRSQAETARGGRPLWPSLGGLAMLAGLALATVALTPGWVAAEATAIRDVRIAHHGDRTRVVIDLDRPVAFNHFTLDQPPRLAIDLPATEWRVSDRDRNGVGMVEGFRIGRHEGALRIVFDVDQRFEIAKVFELQPNGTRGHRIVTDLAPPSAVRQISDINGVTAAALSVGSVPARKRAKHVVVIDPGHGDKDPGAIGSQGTYEKDVVLAVALELRRQLQGNGRYQVEMTRDTDQTVGLRERLAVARRSRGELFLSLHADSLVQSIEVRGASVYTLSEKASNEEAARLATSENLPHDLYGVDLRDQESIVSEILIDLAQRASNNKSIQFAEILTSQHRAFLDVQR